MNTALRVAHWVGIALAVVIVLAVAPFVIVGQALLEGRGGPPIKRPAVDYPYRPRRQPAPEPAPLCRELPDDGLPF